MYKEGNILEIQKINTNKYIPKVFDEILID